MKRRFPPGCWGPLMISLGVAMMFVGWWLGFATAVLTSSDGKVGGMGFWGNVFAAGSLLLVGGLLLLLVQGLLWLVHKAMKGSVKE